MGSNEIRRTNDKIVESQSDKTGQAESQANGSKSWNEKLRKHVGPGFAGRFVVTGLGVLAAFQGIVGAEGSTPEAHSTALTQRDSGSDKAIGLPPAFPTDQRAEIIGKSPTEPYVPAPRPEWLTPYQGPTVQKLWPSLYEQIKSVGEKTSETSSSQLEQDKSKEIEPLKLSNEDVGSLQSFANSLKKNKAALQGFRKLLNDKDTMEGMRDLMQNEEFRKRALSELRDDKSAEQAISLLENIDTLQSFAHSLEQNKAALQGCRKLLNDKDAMEGMRNLMQDEEFRKHALSALKDEKSVKHAISLLENETSNGTCTKWYKQYTSPGSAFHQECC